MDRRACPNYEAFDACDPIGSVFEWSGRCPGRVLRRRCRSEGIERSPYEDVNRDLLQPVEGVPRYKITNKSHFTRREGYSDRFNNECSLPAAENGDYLMAHEQNRHYSYHPPARSKSNRLSPSRQLLVTTLSNTKVDDIRLPKVEELLEKVEDMTEVTVAKQPLKSILNNPLPKNPPQGILKKPKSKVFMDPKSAEGRRRQRAASESDNLYCRLHLQSPVQGFDRRVSHLSSNMKRAKDNSGTGYTNCSALATLSTPLSKSPTSKSAPLSRSPTSKIVTYQKSRCACKDGPKKYIQEMHLLKTTAINSSTIDEDYDLPRPEIPNPACPAVSPALPVSSVAAVPAKKPVKMVKKKVKRKPKVTAQACSKMDCGGDDEGEDVCSRSPSPDFYLANWQMETDSIIADLKLGKKEIDKSAKIEKEKQEKPPPPPATVQKKTEETVDQNSVTKLSDKLNGTAVSPPKNVPSKESSVCLPESVTSSLRLSLFPRVPPYLKFVSHDESSIVKIPNQIQKHLKWKLTTITPIVVKKTLVNSGFRLMKSECDTAECPQEETVEWIGIWGKHMKSLMFRAIKDGQKMNHFPGTFQIGRKDRLWRNLQKLSAKYGLKEFGIMPKTYVLPHDLKLLKHDWEKHAANNERWIVKPPASARGTGIKVVSRWTQIPKKRAVVVQRYVSKPYLINGSKFDLRLYVLLTSVHPLRIYLYRDGLARFASVKYTDEITSLNDRYMHLTNYSINRLSKSYTPNEDFNACEGHKWTLQTLFHYLKTEKNVDIATLWDSLKDLCIKTIISGEASISSLTKANVTSRYNCYELFGVDVLLDEDLKPWLLEVNISPSLHSASPLDIHVKGPMVTTVLNIAQFQVPSKTNLESLTKDFPHKLNGLPYDSRLYTVYLSKEERDKHVIYTNMEDRDMYLRDILSTLTPDDVRHLIQAEDELTQAGDMERIFPTHDTHKYLDYLAGPRYYNRLFDAWETRYLPDRSPGITLLRNLCDIGYHLEVPPVPLKNDVDAPSPPPSEHRSVPSLESLEGVTSASSCGDSLVPSLLPGAPPLQPRA